MVLINGGFMSNPALIRAIEIIGTQRALAKKCGATQQHVWNWMQSGKVPVNRAIQIEVATNGAVTKEELNPEFFNTMPKITIMLKKTK